MDLSDYLAVLGETDGELRHGQFHDVVLTAGAAYRFPRSDAARRDLRRRADVLSGLADAGLGVAVPRPLPPVRDDYLAMTRVPGEPMTTAADPQRVGIELGRLLGAMAAATDRVAQLIGEYDADRAARFAADVERVLYPLMPPAGRERARRELDAFLALPDPARPVLVHSDLGGENLLWEPGPPVSLVGVLDWDDVFLGSQAHDVASIAATYGWEVAGIAARNLDAEVIAQARVIVGTFALQQALPAALSGDQENLDDGLSAYR